MPGLIALINKERNQPLPVGLMTALQEKVFTVPGTRCSQADLGPAAQLQIIHHDKSNYGFLDSSDWCLAWNGHPYTNGKALTTQSWPQAQVDLTQHGAQKWLASLTGHFQLFLYSRTNHQAWALSDKIASMPWYCAEADSFFAFAPEALAFRALKPYGWQGKINQRAIFEFMASGMLWGDDSYWSAARRIGPGRYIEIAEGQQNLHIYWKMISHPGSEKPDELCERLYTSVQDSINQLPAGNLMLSLSGGLDSRALLGFLQAGQRDFEAISFDLGDQGTSVDTNLGKYFAAKAGVKHHIYRVPEITHGDKLFESIETMIQVSGGEDEISASQSAFSFPGIFNYLNDVCTQVLFGHEMWGWGSHAPTIDVAFWDCLVFNLDQFAQPAKLLQPSVFSQACEDLNARKQEMVNEYGDVVHDPFDLKEYLTWINKESRYVIHSDYIYSSFFQVHTPFLFDNTLEVLRQVPSRLKRKKALFSRMCIEKFPALFLNEGTPTSYLTGKNQIELALQNEQFKSLMHARLREELPDTMSGILNHNAFNLWLDEVIHGATSGIAAQRRHYNFKWFLNNLARKWPWLHGHIRAMLLKRGQLNFPALDANFIFRMFTLASTLRQYESD